MNRQKLLSLIFVLGFSMFLPGYADAGSSQQADLFEMPIEQLMEVEITSSARRPQSINRASRAVYIITADDIRQSGPVRIEDLFRMVPGMDVFRTKGLESIVGSRGYSKWNNERMQILLDGRPLYDPYLGGALFYLHPIFLDEIERIEVIRGSAGVAWGVNAMNGVINIITKKTSDTQGGLGYVALGNHQLRQDFLRYGGAEGPLSWRAMIGTLYGRGFARDQGIRIMDDYNAFQSTGRGELKLDKNTILTLTGGHQNASSNNETLDYFNLQWEKRLEDGSMWQLRWTESYIFRHGCTNYFSGSNNYLFNRADTRSREDIFEVQHNILFGRHNLVWGGDYSRDVYRSSPRNDQQNTIPEDFANDQVSMFIEDEIELADDLWFTLGGRGYYNELTHFDWAANLAMVWEFTPGHFLRGALARAFRRPTMWQMYRAGPLKYDGYQLQGEGNDSLKNEKMISYEIGYRGHWSDTLAVNIEGYINKDEDMMAKHKGLLEQSQPWLPGSDWVEEDWYDKWDNIYDVTTYGLETSIEWEPKPWWLLRAFHTYIHQTRRNELTNWRTGETGIILNPKHRVGLTNRFNLDEVTTLNTQLYWTDTATPYYEYIPGKPFWRLDVRLARRLWNDRAELAVGASNLLDRNHYEGGYDWGTNRYNEVPRQFYVEFYCHF
mgnify:CR=1 FL=1